MTQVPRSSFNCVRRKFPCTEAGIRAARSVCDHPREQPAPVFFFLRARRSPPSAKPQQLQKPGSLPPAGDAPHILAASAESTGDCLAVNVAWRRECGWSPWVRRTLLPAESIPPLVTAGATLFNAKALSYRITWTHRGHVSQPPSPPGCLAYAVSRWGALVEYRILRPELNASHGRSGRTMESQKPWPSAFESGSRAAADEAVEDERARAGSGATRRGIKLS